MKYLETMFYFDKNKSAKAKMQRAKCIFYNILLNWLCWMERRAQRAAAAVGK
jgi:hypothetical protein